MTRLERVIEQVKSVRNKKNKAWIFDDNGQIKDNILCCEVLDILDEMKNFEINVNDKYIKEFLYKDNVKSMNTYNSNACISNDLNIHYLETENNLIMIISVHLTGDIRMGYSECFVCKFDSIYEFYDMESLRQCKKVSDSMVADLNALDEMYDVYDYDKEEVIGSFYELELSDLLEQIQENNINNQVAFSDLFVYCFGSLQYER